MKCPKCGTKMTLLFVNYRCYHCNPSKNEQMNLDLDIKIPKKSKEDPDDGILGPESYWEGYD